MVSRKQPRAGRIFEQAFEIRWALNLPDKQAQMPQGKIASARLQPSLGPI